MKSESAVKQLSMCGKCEGEISEITAALPPRVAAFKIVWISEPPDSHEVINRDDGGFRKHLCLISYLEHDPVLLLRTFDHAHVAAHDDAGLSLCFLFFFFFFCPSGDKTLSVSIIHL